MSNAIAPTYASERTYRYRRVPAYPGQLHLKTWAYTIPPTGPDDPVWAERAAAFWRLQAETFGIRYEDHVALMVDYKVGCVTTAAHVLEVLPGKREHGYVTPRVAERRIIDGMKVATDDPDA